MSLNFSNLKNKYEESSYLLKQSSLNHDLMTRLLNIGRVLIAKTDIKQLLKESLEIAIQISAADRGMILLFDENGEILLKIKKNISNENNVFQKSNEALSRKNKLKVFDSKRNQQIQFLNKTYYDNRALKPISNKSVIYMNFKKDKDVFGVLYLDNLNKNRKFSNDIKEFLKAFIDFISVAAYNLLEKQRIKKRMHLFEWELRSKYNFDSIIGSHPKMVDLLKLVSQIADTDAIVLIQGESGSGKELIARALHFNSSRRDKLFVPINCGALPENLLESELFGHVRGAFTGAVNEKKGLFERADGGTIFLDEVGEMSPALQVKLLRVLQNGEYSRVGESKIGYSDVRVIAATNKDLQTLVKKNIFREDLYYRLNLFDLVLPPLRERKSDIPLLINHFMDIFKEKYEKDNINISKKVNIVLLAYDYPGNCRELEHIIQHAVLLAEGEYIELNHLPARLFPRGEKLESGNKPSSFKIAKQNVVEKFERDYVCDCLKTSKGNVSKAATVAGINVKNFYQKMNKYEIDSHAFKSSHNSSQSTNFTR